ncbi:response regulator transcription factor [Flavobacterium wongokense]|uniref:response regulator transcription factor n=1 Tax=Flavobacterium wongokense TaxID=2910674 RepID=UPI001F212BEA|nr:response regulator transcription factor [Flavobacterium sp. WG47]MCF6132404.1 response regulator transcription factor [Flavobacterium sp. WG47]
MKHSIVIVDDHILIAKALRSIMANFNDFEVLYECENGKELQDKFTSKKNIPTVVLLDISMPIMDGFETAKWLRENHPDVLVLALSMQDNEQSLIKMIKNGARGYLLKNVAPSELETALKTIINNGFYYPEWASNIVFSNMMGNVPNNHTSAMTSDLSEREKEFLKLCITEMSYKEISEKMFCSPRTIESYRNSLCEKLNIKTRVGLAVFAIKSGLG